MNSRVAGGVMAKRLRSPQLRRPVGIGGCARGIEGAGGMLREGMTQVGDIVDVTAIDPDPERRPLGFVAARPLVWVAVGLIGGIAAGKPFGVAVPMGIGVGAAGILLAILLRRFAVVATASLLFAAAGVGMALVTLSSTHYPSDHIAHFTTETRRLAQIQMRIINPPRIYAPTFGQAHPMPAKQVTIARVTGVLTRSGWQAASGDILVQIAEPHPRLRVGQTVRAWGMVDRPAPAMNPGQFDWADCARADRNEVIRTAFWQKMVHFQTPAHNAKRTNVCSALPRLDVGTPGRRVPGSQMRFKRCSPNTYR